jgi:N-acetylneuraminic acid mutarotase
MHAASVVDGVIYLIGGVTLQTFPNATTLVQAYDPKTGTFTDKKPMPTARHSLKTCVLGGMIYAIGGSRTLNDPNSPIDRVEMYNPKTDSWYTKPNLPEPRMYMAAASSNGAIYVLGGVDSQHYATYTNFEYKPVTNQWSEKAPMIRGRNGHCACCCDKGDIYVFGGQSDPGQKVDCYDPLTHKWQNKKDMIDPIEYLECCTACNHIFIMGGRRSFESPVLSTYHEYDPVEDKWQIRETMPLPRIRHTVSVVDDTIYVIGGTIDNTENGLTRLIHVYVPINPASAVEEKYMPTETFALIQNYPNPFNPVTTISYQLPMSSDVSLAIYNVKGQLIETLVDVYQNAGTHSVQWEAKDVSSGIYLYKLKAGVYTEVRKCMLLR